MKGDWDPQLELTAGIPRLRRIPGIEVG